MNTLKMKAKEMQVIARRWFIYKQGWIIQFSFNFTMLCLFNLRQKELLRFSCLQKKPTHILKSLTFALIFNRVYYLKSLSFSLIITFLFIN